MDKSSTYVFWVWSSKLEGVLNLISHVSDYQFATTDLDAILEGLRYTNDEKEQWFEYSLISDNNKVHIQFAYDAEEHDDMVHLIVQAQSSIKKELELISAFQSMFQELKLIQPQ